MKNKKITALVLSLLTIVNLFAIVPVLADSVTVKFTRDHYIPGYQFNFSGKGFRCGGHWGQPSVWKLGSNFSYCVELGAPISNIENKNVTIKDSSNCNTLNANQKSLIQRALTYGYRGTTRYGHSANAEYYATQIICWAISEGCYSGSKWNDMVSGALQTCSEASAVRDCLNKMRTQIDEHNTLPNFGESSTVKTLVYNGSKCVKVLTDQNNMLDYYHFESSNSNVTVSKDGNKLTISAPLGNYTSTITATRVKSRYLTKAEYTSVGAYFYDDGKNNGKNGNQDLTTYRGTTASPSRTYTAQTDICKIEIQKQATDNGINGQNMIQNISFNVKGPNYNKNFTTNSSGHITINNVPSGTYTITELNQPSRYYYTAPQTQTISSGGTGWFTFNNNEKYRQLYIHKTVTQALLAKGITVENWVFRIDFKGFDGGTFTFPQERTDDKGIILKTGYSDYTLAYGTYTVTEIGYMDNGVLKSLDEIGAVCLSQNPQTIVVDEQNPYGQVYFSNDANLSKLTIFKTSEDGLNSDIKFHIEGKTDEGQDYSADGQTGPTGELIFDDLKPGTYTVTEIMNEYGEKNYIQPASQTVTLGENDSKTLFFTNKLKRGTVKIQKTSEDGVVQGCKFKITIEPSSAFVPARENIELIRTTDKNGYIELDETEAIPGKYTVEEIEVDDKYMQPKSQTKEFSSSDTDENRILKFNFTNYLKYGYLRFKKLDSETNKQIIDKTQDFKNAEFKLYEWSNTEQQYISYECDWTISKITGAIQPADITNGQAYAHKLYINDDNEGKFKLVEETAPNGYIKSEKEWEFVLSPTSDENRYNDLFSEVVNTPQKGKIGIYKVDEDYSNVDDNTGIELLAGAEFEIYAKEDIIVNGDVKYTAGTLVDTVTTNSANAVESKELYLGAYEVVETKAPYGCVIDTTRHTVNLEYQGQDVDVFTEYLTVENKLQKGNISITKLDSETDKALANAEFSVYAEEDIIINNVKKYTAGELVDTVITGTDGKGTSRALYLGKYKIKETKAPNGYFLDETEHKVTLSYQGETVAIFTEQMSAYNKPQKGTISISKLDKETDKGIAGAEFSITAKEDIIVNGDVKYTAGTLVDTVTIGTDGKGTSKELYLGAYEVVETKAPVGYVLDITKYTVNLEYQGQDVDVFIEPMSAYNTPQKGTISISKLDKETDKGIAGAEFSITAKEDIIVNGDIKASAGTLVDTVTIGADGKGTSKELYLGAYEVLETKAPVGYVLDTTKYQVALSYKGQDISVFIEPMSAYNKPQKGTISISKLDKETDKGIAGAEFSITAKEDIIVNGDVKYTAGTLVDTVTIGTDGKGISKELYLGAYEVVETKAPVGYVLDITKYTVNLEYQGQDVDVFIEPMSAYNKPQKGTISISKLDKETDKGIAGAEFSITAKEDIVVNGDIKASAGTLVDTVTIGADGKGTSKELYLGEYEVLETKAPVGYVLDTTKYQVALSYKGQDISVFIEPMSAYNKPQKGKISISKVDKETNKPIIGAEFEIYAKEDVVVNGDIKASAGTLVDTIILDTEAQKESKELYLGKYNIVETKAPKGYALDTTERIVELKYQGQDVDVFVTGQNIENAPQKGVISIEKQGEVLTDFKTDESKYGKIYTPVYENRFLSGAEFSITAKEDIIVNGDVKYTAGTLVDTVTTNSDAPVNSKELYLGAYEVVETKAPDGYVLDTTRHTVNLKYQGQDISVFTEKLNINNNRQKAIVTFLKTIEENNNYPNPEAYKNIRFGIFSLEALTDNNNKAILPADSLIDVISIDEKGNGTSAVDLPLGKYYLKEIETAKGYGLLETKFNFEFKSNQTEEIQTIDINNNDIVIINKPLFGNLEISKTDKVTGNTLSGAVYGIYRKSDDKLIENLKTDKDGKAQSSLLPYGEYYLKEIEAPVGYVLDENIYDFFIGANGKNNEVITFDVTDDPVEEAPVIGKVDLSYKESGGSEKVEYDYPGSPVTDDLKKNILLLGCIAFISGGIVLITGRKKKSKKVGDDK